MRLPRGRSEANTAWLLMSHGTRRAIQGAGLDRPSTDNAPYGLAGRPAISARSTAFLVTTAARGATPPRRGVDAQHRFPTQGNRLTAPASLLALQDGRAMRSHSTDGLLTWSVRYLYSVGIGRSTFILHWVCVFTFSLSFGLTPSCNSNLLPYVVATTTLHYHPA